MASTETGETDENLSCQKDIIAMLSLSGYHRARVSCLDNYNKIIGGMAWAITRFDDVAVAADLLYEESEDQNIKLRTEQSEKIIEALEAVQCPHKISAHQIFGLDGVALKNVVQWLLRRVLSQDGNAKKNHQFTQWFSTKYDNKLSAMAMYVRRLKYTSENRMATTRHMKRFDNSVMFDLLLDARCTLAEYVTYSRTGERLYPAAKTEEPADNTTNMKESSTKKYASTSTVRAMMDEATIKTFKDESESLKAARERICDKIDEFNIPQRLWILENRLGDEAAAFLVAKQNLQQLNERFKKVMTQVSSSDQTDLTQMAEIMKTFQDTQTRAQALRTFAVEDLEAAKKHENRLRLNVDKDGKIQKYDPYKRDVMEQFAEKTKQFAYSVRDILALQFRLDRILGVTLSSHYRKRNMERMQDSADMTRVTKAAVIDYNVTIDILTFSTKITSFINEVEKSLMTEGSSQEYREAFVAYMNDVRTQLGEYHWKAKLTQDKTIAEKEALNTLRHSIRMKEREVAYTSGEMKKLLQMNKNLQEVAATMTEIESKSPSFQRSEARKAAERTNK